MKTYGFKSSSRLSYAFLASFILTPLSRRYIADVVDFFDNLVYIVGIKSLLPIKDRIAAVYKRIFVFFEFFAEKREDSGDFINSVVSPVVLPSPFPIPFSVTEES